LLFLLLLLLLLLLDSDSPALTRSGLTLFLSLLNCGFYLFPSFNLIAIFNFFLRGLKYHYVAVTASSKSDPEFLKLNPLALIPVLVDGDFVLVESLAIIMVGPPTHDFNSPVSLIYSYLYYV
ncbi:uncharacterized protein LOC107645179, partial [Arachis ipaensis]|uniref:uncharacterized protein LOC107645179 n=1 Tax=Arachis ipaensis TaxID=130454 RepID=UPI000A2AF517